MLRRVPLACALAPQDVLRALADRPGPFALSGHWAGGGAIVGSDPLLVAGPDADPFSTLDACPTSTVAWLPAPGAVGGGWFGWLGYRFGRRIERLPEGPPRPVPLPDFHLAYYDHLLRLDPRWALVVRSARRRRRGRAASAAGWRTIRALLSRPISPEHL